MGKVRRLVENATTTATPTLQALTRQFIFSLLSSPLRSLGWVKKIDNIKSASASASSTPSSSFFGFPTHPPFFYPSQGGMVGLVNNQVGKYMLPRFASLAFFAPNLHINTGVGVLTSAHIVATWRKLKYSQFVNYRRSPVHGCVVCGLIVTLFIPTRISLTYLQVSAWPADSVTLSSSHRVTSVEKVRHLLKN